MSEESEGGFKAGWNLAEPMMWDIANRLKTARDSFLAGNLDKYYWNLEAVVRVLYGFLTPDEREEAAKQELVIQNYLSNKQGKEKLSILLKKYDGLVMVLLHEHKFLVPPKKDRTKLIG